MPNLRQLEYLVALADTLHFRRAAERTNTTQPTLSEQLKALEDRLGAQLVERGRSRMMLTPIGAQVVAIARRMLADAAEIRTIAASGGKDLAGLLRLGLPPTIGPYLLPHLLPALRATHPDLRLYVRESLPEALPRALEEGVLDVVITLLPIRQTDLTSIELFREPLFLTVPADHSLAAKASVSRADLEGQDILTLGPGHQLHGVVMALCDEFGARLRLDFEGTSLATLREMVLMGLGVTFLPGLYVKREVLRDANLRVLPLQGRALYRTVGMVWRKSSSRQASFEKLAAFFREAMQGEFADLPASG